MQIKLYLLYIFPIFAPSDLVVAVNGTQRTITTDYTVTGANTSTGGTVVFTSGLNLNDAVSIIRAVPISRTTDFQTGGALLADVMNEELDKIVTMIQQLRDSDSDVAIRMNELSGGLPISSIPPTTVAERANKLVSFNTAGQPVATQELGSNKGDWTANTIYYARDLIKDPTTKNVYQATVDFTSGVSFSSAGLLLVVDAATATTAANTATTQASQAAASATSASGSAVNAQSSEDDAATANANAQSHETNAATSASNAAQSELDAANAAATIAADKLASAQSALQAAQSATAAQTAEANAEAIQVGSLVDNSIGGAKLTTGTIALNKFSATGTADATTFLRGDNTWQVVDTSIAAGAIGTTELANDSVTYAKIQNEAANTILGNNTGSVADTKALTVTEAQTLIVTPIFSLSGTTLTITTP